MKWASTNLRFLMLFTACLMVMLPVLVPYSVTGAPQDDSSTEVSREWFAGWTMESRVARAQLVMVARVSSVSPISVIHGAKADTNLREYRFQPVSVLKGVFTRPELSMTDTDLGLPAPDANADAPLKADEHILLILSRSRGRSTFCCVALPRGTNEPRQLIPRLAGLDDPIVAMTQTMIRISQASSRQQRAKLSIDELGQTKGPAYVPLLLSLVSRGDWIQSTAAAKLLADLTVHKSPAISTAATSVVSRVLTFDATIPKAARTVLASALQTKLNSNGLPTALRSDALKGLGHLGEFGRQEEWVSQLLVDHLQNAQTHAERGGAAAALQQLRNPATADIVLKTLQALPLDEPPAREAVYIEAAVSLARTNASPVLLERLKKKLAGVHAATSEIRRLGQLQYREAIPALLQAARDGKHNDEVQIADAFAVIKDERAIVVLADWLKSTNSKTRSAAMRALDAIDSPAIVDAIQQRFRSESDLSVKLHMATVLGRHGVGDGYDLAMEHLADAGMTTLASKALAAIKDDRTSGQLWASLNNGHDTEWAGAALQGLAALGDAKVAVRLEKILADNRSPLLPAAISAAAVLGDPSLIPSVTPHLLSRNDKTALGSMSTIKALAAAVQEKQSNVDSLEQAGAALIEVLNNPDIHVNQRKAALSTLEALKDSRLAAAKKRLADDAFLENSKIFSAFPWR